MMAQVIHLATSQINQIITNSRMAWMSKVVVADQISIYGDVDIPYSPNNAMALLSALGELGFSPTTFSEPDPKTDQVMNRLSFIKNRATIKFHPDRIIFGNTPDPSKELEFDFNETAISVLKIIFTSYPNLKSSRCIRSGDYISPEIEPQQMVSFRKAHLNNTELEPLAWHVRQTYASEDHKEKVLYTIEIGRAQGHLTIDSNKIPFDRIRYKVITQTDISNRVVRYDSKATLRCVNMLISEHTSRLSQVESSVHE